MIYILNNYYVHSTPKHVTYIRPMVGVAKAVFVWLWKFECTKITALSGKQLEIAAEVGSQSFEQCIDLLLPTV